MHYLLVGLALATFYLLLISFSEHFGFGLSYLLATLGCTTLLAFYITGIMQDWRMGLAFAGKFLGLYGMLYVILRSEDNALLMGSLLIFVALGLVMMITRRLDWYEVGEQMGRMASQIGQKPASPEDKVL
jgi:inner membrane protein